MIKEVRWKTELEEDLQTGSLEVTVYGDGKQEPGTFLWAVLKDEDGNEADRIFPLPMEEKMQFCMQVQKARLWNAEEVCLYELVVEQRDEKEQVLQKIVKKTGFCRQEVNGQGMKVNGRKISVRPVSVEEPQKKILSRCKRNFYNTLVVQDGEERDNLQELCMEFGLYRITWEEWQSMGQKEKVPREKETLEGIKPEEHPDFELNVVRQGVLIENKSFFQNVSDYAINCVVYEEGVFGRKTVRQCRIDGDVPPGSSRYIEFPFDMTGAIGKHIYRAELARKKKVAWLPEGQAEAAGETIIMDFGI